MQNLLGVNCMRGPCRAQLGGSGGPQADLGPWPLKVSKKHCLGAAILGPPPQNQEIHRKTPQNTQKVNHFWRPPT